MLKNVEIQIFLPHVFSGIGVPYIIYNGNRYYIDKNTSRSILGRIPKNKETKININGKITKNQFGYGVNGYHSSNIILIKKLNKII